MKNSILEILSKHNNAVVFLVIMGVAILGHFLAFYQSPTVEMLQTGAVIVAVVFLFLSLIVGRGFSSYQAYKFYKKEEVWVICIVLLMQICMAVYCRVGIRFESILQIVMVGAIYTIGLFLVEGPTEDSK